MIAIDSKPATPATVHASREDWFNAAVEIFRPVFQAMHASDDTLPALPEKIRISVGWGSIGARQESAVVLGVTYHTSASEDGVNEIFISPEDASAMTMLATLLHELVHVALNNQDGHKGRFTKMAKALKLTGKMTSTTASDELAPIFEKMIETLGAYPGARMNVGSRRRGPDAGGFAGFPDSFFGGRGFSSSGSTQGTRMLKVSCQEAGCPAIGYTVRMTQKWINEFGTPICPADNPFAAEEPHRLTR